VFGTSTVSALIVTLRHTDQAETIEVCVVQRARAFTHRGPELHE
jgi:hypothetical protein